MMSFDSRCRVPWDGNTIFGCGDLVSTGIPQTSGRTASDFELAKKRADLMFQIIILDYAIAGMELAIATTPDLGCEEKNAIARRDLEEARAERATLQALLDAAEVTPAEGEGVPHQ